MHDNKEGTMKQKNDPKGWANRKWGMKAAEEDGHQQEMSFSELRPRSVCLVKKLM